MAEQEPVVEHRRFGRYLRRIRETRRLSLDAVEEMSTGYPERITKSHLSRIENGQALPTFPRMYALCQIYGVPVSSLAERFEIEYKREAVAADLRDLDEEAILRKAEELRRSGLHQKALQLYELLLDRHLREARRYGRAETAHDLGLQRVNCFVQLGRFASAKDECEDLLNLDTLSPRQRVLTLQYFAMCCYRLGKHTVALLVLEDAGRKLDSLTGCEDLFPPLATLRGRVMVMTGQAERAVEPFRQSLAGYEALGNAFEACRARINYADALIRSDRDEEAQEPLRCALVEAEEGGFDRLRALALSNLGELAYRAGNPDRAEANLLQSNTIARPRDFHAVVFRNCFYLWRIAGERGDAPAANANERSLRSFLSRVDESLPEAEAYRAYLTGGEA